MAEYEDSEFALTNYLAPYRFYLNNSSPVPNVCRKHNLGAAAFLRFIWSRTAKSTALAGVFSVLPGFVVRSHTLFSSVLLPQLIA